MFNLFRRKQPTPLQALYFKGNAEAFHYACAYMATPLLPQEHAGKPNRNQSSIIGLVHGPAPKSSPFSTPANYYDVSLAVHGGPARVSRCGSLLSQLAMDRLKGEKTEAAEYDVLVAPPRTGDLVLVEIGTYNPDRPIDHMFNYFIILFRLKPEFVMAKRGFRLELGGFFS